MDIRELITFHRIAGHGSFIRAAEELNYAQSTVTMQMQKLESGLGVQLFERGKAIRLTEAGRLFLEQSLPVLKDMERLQEAMSGLSSGNAGQIRLGVTEPTASYRLPGVISSFIGLYPNIKISLVFGNTPYLSGQLVKGDIDLALCSAPDLGSGLVFEPLFREEFTVLLPEDHPLKDLEVIDPEDFAGHRLLVTSAVCPYRRKLEMVLQEAGGIRLETMEIGSMTALKSYVASGIGIALVPAITADPAPPGTIMRPVSGSLIEMTFGILCSTAEKRMKPAGYRLYHFLKERLSSSALTGPAASASGDDTVQ